MKGEIAMSVNVDIKNRDKVKESVDVGVEASKTALGVGIALSALVGLWAVACLIGGLSSSGVLDTIRGYISAVTGM